MEDKQETSQTTQESPQQSETTTPPTEATQKQAPTEKAAVAPKTEGKKNIILWVAIALILLISVGITTLLFINQKRISQTQTPHTQPKPGPEVHRPLDKTPTPSPTPTPTPTLSFRGYNPDGKKFTLVFPEDCNLEEFDTENWPSRKKIICPISNFKITINPQAGGRGFGPLDEDDQLERKRVAIGGYTWERLLIIFANNTGFSTYGMTAPDSGDYYLIEVEYSPYSPEALSYFEQILSTFEFLD